MSTLQFLQFSGEIPKLIPRLLPDTSSQSTKNVRLNDGALTPIRKPRYVTDSHEEAKTIYKHGDDWLSFTDRVSVANSAVDNDRIYYTGDGAPKMRVPDGRVFDLAVAYPVTPIVATKEANYEYQYAYTYVDENDVESTASPLSESVEFNANRKASVTEFADVPDDVVKQRLYRIDENGIWYYRGERNAVASEWFDDYYEDDIQSAPISSTISAPSFAPVLNYETIVTKQDTYYTYTFVTEFGEESEPCALGEAIAWEAGVSVTLSGFDTAPAGSRITMQRIYRSQSSGDSGAGLYLLAERNASAVDFIDDYDADEFMEVIPSTDWNAPPSDLHSLISLPNGMMAGLSGKVLYFCEPFRPHAWPEKYALTLDYEGVALGAYATSVVVLTDGLPYVVSGTAPENMIQERINRSLPCINANGVVNMGYSVCYPSPEGIVLIGTDGVSLSTDAVIARTWWLMHDPASMVCSQHAGRYFASYEYIDENARKNSGTLILNTLTESAYILQSDIKADAFHYDVGEGNLYFLSKGVIYEWDAYGEENAVISWRSKRHVLPSPVSFGALKIECAKGFSVAEVAVIRGQNEEIATENRLVFADDSLLGALNDEELNDVQINGSGQVAYEQEEGFVSVDVYAGGEYVTTVNKRNEVARLPAGFKSDDWEICVNANIQVERIVMATTVREMNNV